MVEKLRLRHLVDLALCSPEVGAVNFNHLRSLLLAILKLTHTSETIVEQIEDENKETSEIVRNPLDEKISNRNHAKVIIDDSNEGDGKSIGGLLTTKQKELEIRVKELEQNMEPCIVFPSADEFLAKEERTKRNDKSPSNAEDVKRDDNSLRAIWHNKKCLRRLGETEEAIEKIFSIIQIVTNKGMPRSAETESEDFEDRFTDVQMKLKERDGKVDERIKNNTNMINEMMTSLTQSRDVIDACVKQGKENNENIKILEKKGDGLLVALEKKKEALGRRMSSLEGELGRINSNLEGKVDFSELERRFAESNAKTINQLDSVTIDFELIQSKVDKMATELHGVQDHCINLKSDTNDQMAKLSEQLNFHTTKNDSTMNELNDEITKIKEYLGNRDEESSRQEPVVNDITETKHNAEKDEMKNTISHVQNKLEEIETRLVINEDKLKDINQIPLTSKEIDTSVLAAIQHLVEENRQHVTALQENMRIVQKMQMTPKTTVSNNEVTNNNSNNNNNSSNNNDVIVKETFELLQNHLLILEEEQVKQSGHVSNMVDDYKAEFTRKQLHIDKLYEYIERLQNDKANRDDVITVEMNVKQDKALLDNKVSMTTFDERWRILEGALQNALQRLNHYAEEEETLKSSLSRLSEDVNSKMDSDAEKKLRKFLDERLKAIQASRDHLTDTKDVNDTAAGLRRPMSLNYNCLSCDRSIDATMKGITSAVPYNMPLRTPLKTSGKSDRRNRPCGGSHTSVNVNSVRVMKVSPLLTSSEHAVTSSPTVGNEQTVIVDGVVGRNGHIYRGRTFYTQDVFLNNQNDQRSNTKRGRGRPIHSARPSTRSSVADASNIGDRPFSEASLEDTENPYYFPPINDALNNQS